MKCHPFSLKSFTQLDKIEIYSSATSEANCASQFFTQQQGTFTA
jgi:hypothetical protein